MNNKRWIPLLRAVVTFVLFFPTLSLAFFAFGAKPWSTTIEDGWQFIAQALIGYLLYLGVKDISDEVFKRWSPEADTP